MQFKTTEEVNRFNAACEVTRQGAFMGLITGAPGVGKTRCARKYADEYSSCTYISLNPFSERQGNLVIQLADAVGTYYSGRTYKTYKSLKHCLNSYSFLMIDEADFLSDNGLNIIRLLWDETRCPIMLIGSNYLIGRIEDKRQLQLKSRIGIYEVMGRLSLMELQKIFPGMDTRHIRFIYKRTQGNFRLIDRLITQVDRMSELNKLEKPNKAIFEEAARLVRVG